MCLAVLRTNDACNTAACLALEQRAFRTQPRSKEMVGKHPSYGTGPNRRRRWLS